jgi:hypothetical protein
MRRLNEHQGLGAANQTIFFNDFFLKTNKYISLTGGSLGSWIDEERSKMR